MFAHGGTLPDASMPKQHLTEAPCRSAMGWPVQRYALPKAEG